MPGPLDGAMNLASGLTAYYGATSCVDIFDVDYNSPESVQYQVGSRIPIRLDPAGARAQALPPLPGVNYFVVAGPKDGLKAGQLMIPSDGDTRSPAATILNNLGMTDTIAIRTNQVGEIRSGSQVIYSNVWFDFYVVERPEAVETDEFTGSPMLDRQRAQLFYRPEIVSEMQLVLSSGRRYQIKAVAGVGNLSVIELRRDPR